MGTEVHRPLGRSWGDPTYQYFRLGLRSVEIESSRKEGTNQEDSNKLHKYERLDLGSRKSQLVNESSATIHVVFSSETTDEIEAMGIHGRTIQILTADSGELLARRTEFWWYAPNKRRSFLPLENVCPPLAIPLAIYPQDFLAKVLNPQSYPCWKLFRDAQVKEAVGDYVPNSQRLLQELQSCESTYYKEYQSKPTTIRPAEKSKAN